MRKTIVIALREYSAAVKSKGFLISLILLPIMMSAGLIAQKLSDKVGDTSTRSVAVIDRSPEGKLYGVIAQAVEKHNAGEINDESGRQVRARFALEKIDPVDAGNPVLVERQRLELSDRVRSGELLAFVEIGDNVLNSRGVDDEHSLIRYSTNRPTYRDFRSLLTSAVRPTVVKARLAINDLSDERLRQAEPTVSDRGLAQQRDGKISYESEKGQIASFMVPLGLLLLMFIIVLVGTSPMTGNVIEEKQLRIAEVLLGSVRPFELMMGKLLGGVGVALTLAIIYVGGAIYVAIHQGVMGYISPATIVWFVFFTILATLMYGAMFVAVGAAVTNVKEAQTMIMPVMLLIVLPISMLGSVIRDPSGPIATFVSLFPFSAPMMMTARIGIPPGVPVWQMVFAAGISVATTIMLVWAAGRIFRVGILMQGQGANYAELAKWIVRG